MFAAELDNTSYSYVIIQIPYSRFKITHLPKPQASKAQGEDFLIADQSDFVNSNGLYCVAISHSYCCVKINAEIGGKKLVI